jgi:hypothetical protein
LAEEQEQEQNGNGNGQQEEEADQQQQQQAQKILRTFDMKNIENEIEKDSLFVNLQSGDKRVFKFDPTQQVDAVESVYEGKKTIRYRVRVFDVNTQTMKYWTVSRRLLEQINDYVKEEIYTLAITRKGTKTDTRYIIIPVMDQGRSNEDPAG